MFKISRLTDYALRIVVHLAKSSELQSAAAVAVATGISEPTVRKILKMLNETTFINSTQGATGGYRLAATLPEISLAMLINAMEGDIAITDCSQQASCCVDAATCGFQAPWQYVNTKIQNLLNNISLAEMLKIKHDQEIKYYPKEELPL